MKDLNSVYENLQVMITDEEEKKDFKAIYDKAMEERTPGDTIFFASIMYAYGKTVGISKERDRK